jgi:hypothetical protein
VDRLRAELGQPPLPTLQETLDGRGAGCVFSFFLSFFLSSCVFLGLGFAFVFVLEFGFFLHRIRARGCLVSSFLSWGIGEDCVCFSPVSLFLAGNWGGIGEGVFGPWV